MIACFRQLRNRAIREDKIRVGLVPFSQPKGLRVESSRADTPATSGNGSLGFLNSPGCAERPFTGTWKLNGTKCGRPALAACSFPEPDLRVSVGYLSTVQTTMKCPAPNFYLHQKFSIIQTLLAEVHTRRARCRPSGEGMPQVLKIPSCCHRTWVWPSRSL